MVVVNPLGVLLRDSVVVVVEAMVVKPLEVKGARII